MTGREVNERLKAAGLKAIHDFPESGRITIDPPGRTPPELAELIKAHKPALLAHLREVRRTEADVVALGDRLEQPDAPPAGTSPDRAVTTHAADPFPFGANSPQAPDGQAAALLDRLRAAGHAVAIDRADRSRLRVEPALPADLKVLVIAGKAGLLEELEREARVAELAAGPDPFRGPGVGSGGVAEGAVRVAGDGLAGGPPGPLGGDAADAAGGVEATGSPPGPGGAVSPASPAGGNTTPADAVRSAWAGWVRLPGAPKAERVWVKRAGGDTWRSCWDALLLEMDCLGERAVEGVVLRDGRSPV